jgi:hypothetical protein
MKASRSALILTVSIAVIAAVSFLLVIVKPATEGPSAVTYNGFEFRNVGGLWRTAWERDGQPYELDFRYNPSEVEDIPVEGSIDHRFQLQATYLTFDPSEGETKDNSQVALAAIEISRKLVDPFERDVVAACTRNETEACASRPIMKCSDTNNSIIYLKQAAEAKIILSGNCVTLQGAGDGIVRAADRALFDWLGII